MASVADKSLGAGMLHIVKKAICKKTNILKSSFFAPICLLADSLQVFGAFSSGSLQTDPLLCQLKVASVNCCATKCKNETLFSNSKCHLYWGRPG